jgi:peroxiredoxin
MLVEDGKIIKMFTEEGFEHNCPTDPYEVSDADTMLGYLKKNQKAA